MNYIFMKSGQTIRTTESFKVNTTEIAIKFNGEVLVNTLWESGELLIFTSDIAFFLTGVPNKTQDHPSVLKDIPQSLPTLDPVWSDTETNPGEVFIFGLCAGLRLDGSLGYGAAQNADFFAKYIKETYNKFKSTNGAYLKAKRDGLLTRVPASQPIEDLPF